MNDLNKKCNYLVLVNRENKVPDDREDIVEFEEVDNAYGDKIKVEKQTLKKFLELKDFLLTKGVDIELDNAYRSISKQQDVRDTYEKKYGIEHTKRYVAVPGYSEHHTGLAIDLFVKKDGGLVCTDEDLIEECEIFAKVHENLADFGFILRYPEGKEDITGYGYEPRHLRYIGVDAKRIYNQGLTFEEYLNNDLSE